MGRKPQAGYPAFPSIPRLNREVWITEKIDGTNGLIYIAEDPLPDERALGWDVIPHDETAHALWIHAGSRNRWLTLNEDNHGFANWVAANGRTLIRDLGPGLHYGEWYGKGINRGYGLDHNRFALFNAYRWDGTKFETPNLECVPVILHVDSGKYLTDDVSDALVELYEVGSYAAKGFNRPEGIVVYHDAAKTYFKVTLENDDKPKSLVNA